MSENHWKELIDETERITLSAHSEDNIFYVAAITDRGDSSKVAIYGPFLLHSPKDILVTLKTIEKEREGANNVFWMTQTSERYFVEEASNMRELVDIEFDSIKGEQK